MLKNLDNMLDTLNIIIDFLIAFFKNVVELVMLIGKGASIAIDIVTNLPVQYQAIMIALISYYIIHTIKNLGG